MPILLGEMTGSPAGHFDLGKFTITRKFRVKADSVLQGPGEIALTPGLPLLYTPYAFGFEFSPVLLCRSIDPERQGTSSLLWEVTVGYETPDPKDPQGAGGKNSDGGGSGKENPQQFLNPLTMIPEIEIHFQSHKEVVYAGYDNLGNMIPLAASTGEVFVPAPERERSYLVLKITRNEDISTPYPAQALIYQDRVNSDTFWGANAGQVRCQSISIQRLEKNYPDGSNFDYLKVTYEFHFRDTWDLQILDKGTWYWTDGTKTKRSKFKTDDNQNTEGLLDGTGLKLPNASTPVFKTIEIYPRVAFGNLQLPQGFALVQ